MRSADSRTARAISEGFAWDNHGCMPLRPLDLKFLPQLSRYKKAGFRVVGINAGFDGVPWAETLRMLASFRGWIARHPKKYSLLSTPRDLSRLKGRLGVFFDIEGGSALNEQLSMVELYRDLGVRWMLIAYNKNNALGGGCQDVDRGLTKFGRQVINEMNRVGMTVCCSHTGYKTTMDVMRRAARPVIFSHSNPLGVWRHKRNIRDEAIKACAATGGVVGINGIGLFLGKNDTRSQTVVTHIDYVVQLVGPDHVGLGLDYVFDTAELEEYLKANPHIFPPAEGYGDSFGQVQPEQLPDIVSDLFARGYTVSDVRKIIGGNFRRIARETWPRRGELLS
ncbi:MAG TPA: membrane dipeptidase [Steroidobacteraceae bacterium]|jgi:membrane dipeptidase|nr:membrane dipeptidase [Steroidobacteraceae bacterium]